MFKCLSPITQYLDKTSVTHTQPAGNAGVSSQPPSENSASVASRSPQRNQGCAISPQRTRLMQTYLLNKAKSAAKKNVEQFFKEFDASKLTEKSRIELARFIVEKNPRALGENIQKLQIADESTRITLARRLSEKDKRGFERYLKNFEIPYETAITKLADLVELKSKSLPGSIAYKSPNAIAQECGVPIESLEAYLKKEISAFVDKMKNAERRDEEEKYFPLLDKIYNLYIMAAKKEDKDLPLPWMRNLKNYDAFIQHFCPSANAKACANIKKYLESFVASKISSGIIMHSVFSGDVKHNDEPKEAYGVGGRTWKKHYAYGRILETGRACVHEQLVDEPILAEVVQLKKSNFPSRENCLFHNTGSSALEGIGKAGAILSAWRVLQSKGNVVTGEYVSYINHHDGETSVTGGKEGLTEVYTLRNSSLASNDYAIQRWFNECPVTFGIDVEKQKEYNEAQGIDKNYDNDRKAEGTVVGPKVPLQNVVAVSAPKDHEAHIQAWIQQYCPWVKFISKEAATIMKLDDWS